MEKHQKNLPITPHKSSSVLRQPYTRNRFKHFTENLVAILLIFITVASLSFAAANFFGDSKSSSMTQEASNLVPAIYLKNDEPDSLSL